MTTDSRKWKMPSPSLVLECIEKWRNIDLRKLSDSDIDKQLTEFLETLGVYAVTTSNTIHFKLWRIRKFNYLFKEIEECWEPPKSKTKLGRCSNSRSL